MTEAQINEIIGAQPEMRHTCGDGAEMLRYNRCLATDYKKLREAYVGQGFTLFCEDPSTHPFIAESSTYVRGDEYAVLFFFSWEYQLHVTISSKGAETLPQIPVEGLRSICPMTVTQPKTRLQGMCEIFRLTDGSFLIFDSSSKGSHDEIYTALSELNGGTEGIHIRIWVMTHVHGDHYGGFLGFAEKYPNAVTLDTVMFAPVNRDVIATLEGYKNSWDTIDYFFNDCLEGFLKKHFPRTVLCSVHAGQRFKLPGGELHILYTPEHVYIERTPVNMNHGSIVAQVIGEEGKALIMGDSEFTSTYWVIKTYQHALRSDIFQYPHHGSGRTPDLLTTVLARSAAILVPCTVDHYKRYSNNCNRMVENWEWTKSTYIMGDGTVTLRMNGECVE